MPPPSDGTEIVEQGLAKIMRDALPDVPDAQLGEWVAIASCPFLRPDGTLDSKYVVAFSGGTMLEHVAMGLSAKLEDILRTTELDE